MILLCNIKFSEKLLPSLFESSIRDNDDALEMFQEHLAEPRPVKLDARNKRSETAFMIACRNKAVECLERMIDIIQDKTILNAVNLEGNTALHFACQSGSFKAAECLANQEVEVNAKTEKEETPLHQASSRGYLEIVELLLNKKADIKAK